MQRLYLISLFLLLSACDQSTAPEQTSASVESASGAGVESTPQASYQQVHAAAVAAIQIAAEKGHAWTTSDALLKKAQLAAQNGDEDGAVELANEARLLAELAASQADTEKTAWRERTLPGS